MTERLNIIFSAIPACDSFADVGCDHGYIAKAMLSSGKCKSAVISDISKNCLLKAEKLLKEELERGVAKSVVSDGIKNIPKTQTVLIAGMGGEEIIKILSDGKKLNNLPEVLVLQPMKNVDKVREFLVELGYKITYDFCFKAGGRFYDLITAEVGKDRLSSEEIYFGRTNLLQRGSAFTERVNMQYEKLSKLLQKEGLNEARKRELVAEIEGLKKYV